MVGGRLRAPHRDDGRRPGHAGLDRGPGVVERPGRHARLLLDRGEPAEAGRDRAPRAARLRADELGRGDRRHPRRRGQPGPVLPGRGADAGGPGRCGTAPYGVRSRPKLPAGRRRRRARADHAALLGQRAQTSATPSTPTALAKSLAAGAERRGAAAHGLRRRPASSTSSPVPPDPSWDDVDLIDASHTGATPSINVNGWLDVGSLRDHQALRVPAAPPGPVPDHGPDRALPDDPDGQGREARRPAGRRHHLRLRRDLRGLVRPLAARRRRRLEADAEGPGVPHGRGHLAHRRDAGRCRRRAERSLYLGSDAGRRDPVGRRRAAAGPGRRRAPTGSAPTRATPSPRSAATWARAARSAPTSGPPSAGPTSSSTARRALDQPVSDRRRRAAPNCTCRPTCPTPTSSSSSSTCTRTAPPTTSRRPRCGCATVTASRTRRASSPGQVYRVDAARDHHGELLRARPPDQGRDRRVELPQRRPQLAHRRPQRPGDRRAGRAPDRCTTAATTRRGSSSASTRASSSRRSAIRVIACLICCIWIPPPP